MTPRPMIPPFDAASASATADSNVAAPCGRRRRPGPLHPVAVFVAILALGLSGVACAAAPVSSQAGSFVFNGSGWGHGVGMSQWGARGFAERGSSYDQILRHYYSGAAVVDGATANDVRVLIGSGSPSFTIRTGGATTFDGIGTPPAGSTVVVTRVGSNVRLSGALNRDVGPGGFTVHYAGSGELTVSPPGYTYKYGMLRIRIDPGGGLRAIVEQLPMQQYLYGLGEMPSSWPMEALKAQATAGRTFAQKRVQHRGASDFDLYGSVFHQAYTGTKFQAQRWVDAVNQTNNKVITYNGGLIDANYSASSGGHTANSETVWVSNVPYLRAVPDPYDGTGGNPHASWSRTYSGAQLGAWFGLGTVTSVQISGASASGRVDKANVRLIGTAGTKNLKGAAFRSTVNARSPGAALMSTRFTVNGQASGGGGHSAPANRAPVGNYSTARADGRVVVAAGTASDPDGVPTVRLVSTMGREVATRYTKANGGRFSFSWNGAPGTRKVCATVYDVPSNNPTELGCHDIVVK